MKVIRTEEMLNFLASVKGVEYVSSLMPLGVVKETESGVKYLITREDESEN